MGEPANTKYSPAGARAPVCVCWGGGAWKRAYLASNRIPWFLVEWHLQKIKAALMVSPTINTLIYVRNKQLFGQSYELITNKYSE